MSKIEGLCFVYIILHYFFLILDLLINYIAGILRFQMHIIFSDYKPNFSAHYY